MKNLLAITLVFILSLFVVEESRSKVSNIILGCEIFGTADDQLTGYFKYRYKTFFKINGGTSPTAIYYSYFGESIRGSMIVDEYKKREYRIDEELSTLTLIMYKNDGYDVPLSNQDDTNRYFLDRETLIGRTEGFTHSYDQCEILPSTKTVTQYVDMHMERFEDFLESERNEQLRKNKI